MNFIHRGEKMAEAGDYNPEKPQTTIEVDFSKVVSRDPYYNGYDDQYMKEYPQGGDVLILDPHRPKFNIPSVLMDKQVHSFIYILIN
jgi:hypothetical protein